MQPSFFRHLHIRASPVASRRPDTYLSAALLLLSLLSGCSRTPSSTYPVLEATLTLLAKQDSTDLQYPAGASSGLVYYVAYPENGDSSRLTELNPATGAERIVARGVGGPLAVAADGKIAALETGYRIVVLDSSGTEVWATNVGGTITTMAFSANGDDIYYCKNGTLLVITIGSAQPHDTILKGIESFSKSPNDSIFIYHSVASSNGDSLHSFYKYDAVSGEQSIILQEGSASGFALNPGAFDELAVGVARPDNGQLLAKQVLMYHINHGIGRVFESSPYEDSYLLVASWAQEGTALLITVTPYIAGDPITPLPREIWMAEDIY